MIAFILGREFRLSIAEINNFFSNSKLIFADREIAFFEGISVDEITSNFYKLGGNIKVIEILEELQEEKNFPVESEKIISEKIDFETGKFCYAFAQYGMNSNIFSSGIKVKKELKKANFKNARFVNKDSNNVNAAVFKKEKLRSLTGIELNFIKAEDRLFLGKTIAYQDVDSYSARDFGKSRDMGIGMLPPKLAQMMINIALTPTLSQREREKNISIYDPFCGLGTILIEALNSGYSNVYGSDLNEKMVEATSKNISFYLKQTTKAEVFKQDSSQIEKVDFLKGTRNISIISEGYLGSIMTKGHVTEEKIDLERDTLYKIYKGFFSGLKKIHFKGDIVICFPFWELKGKYIYFEEVYRLLRDLGFETKKLLPDNLEFKETRSGSLLYHRPGQQVGREIFKLKLG
ncbi:hypothetical protein M0P65_04455 [Candidatus Gracilibacteria bacterium]|nr:hypothetical protein [Candidatus Gracilibacteria bacterium]